MSAIFPFSLVVDRGHGQIKFAARKPTIVKEWKMDDFKSLTTKHDEKSIMRGMQAFMKAQCHQCHKVAGDGINLGPELNDVAKRFKGTKLLQQIIEPSTEVNEKYRVNQFVLGDGKVVAGVIVKETRREYHVVTNLLTPKVITKLRRRNVDEKIPAKLSPMPQGLLSTLTKAEITDLVSFLEAGGYQLPEHLKNNHNHSQQPNHSGTSNKE